jgi:hypothetical protein
MRNHHLPVIIEQTRGRAELCTDRPGRLLEHFTFKRYT